VRPPPTSTLFPYTTLFRSGVGGVHLVQHGAVGAGAGLGRKAGLRVQADPELKHLFAALGLHQLAVLVQRNFRLVGVDLDGGLGFGAVGITLAADMYERLLAPVSLVGVGSILLDLAVKGDQALVVHARLAALVAGVGGKVEHIPHVGAPHIGV